MELVFHIAERAAWQAAQSSGEYRPPSLEREGFIHCSTRAQVIDTANRYYRGRTDLVLLCIDTGQLVPALKYEPPAVPAGSAPRPTPRAELFPHLYAAIPIQAVTTTAELVPNPAGDHAWPADLSP